MNFLLHMAVVWDWIDFNFVSYDVKKNLEVVWSSIETSSEPVWESFAVFYSKPSKPSV